MTEFILVFALAIGLGWPLSRYLAAVMRGNPMRGDGLFLWLERPVYRLLGTDPRHGMTWRTYAGAFLLSNLILGVIVWLILVTQAWLPFNPNGAPNMSWDLALHTMVSFLTNTNQQHYSGQAQLSYLSHTMGIVTLQVITPMMGLALVVATLRGLFGGRHGGDLRAQGQEQRSVDVGNYWTDVVRATVRFMLPLCLICSVLLTSQGVPASFSGGPVVVPIDTTVAMPEQKIPLGPVAPMVAAKQLGTNGGGLVRPQQLGTAGKPYAVFQPDRDVGHYSGAAYPGVDGGALYRSPAFRGPGVRHHVDHVVPVRGFCHLVRGLFSDFQRHCADGRQGGKAGRRGFRIVGSADHADL